MLTRILPHRQVLRAAAVFLLLAAAACENVSIGTPEEVVPGPGDYAGSVRSGGRTRQYELHVPPRYVTGEPLPLVIVFHGVPGTPESIRTITSFNAVADARGWLVAYPAAATGDWDLNCGGCTEAEQRGVDDVRFARDLIAHLRVRARADTERVYAAGFSQGALLTHHLACKAFDAFDAFASVGATMLAPTATDCGPPGGAAFVFVHGTLDPEFPAGGRTVAGLTATPIQATVENWRLHNGCANPPAVVDINPTDDGTVVKRESYTQCTSGNPLVFYRVIGGGHTWPGSPADFSAPLGARSRDISATQEIAAFFEASS